MRVQPLSEGCEVHPLAARSVFWELETPVADPVFEKEAWLSQVLLQFGTCGFTILNLATIYFCPASMAPGVAKLPTAPVSKDAAVVTSIFVDPGNTALEAVLLDTVTMNLVSRGLAAVEAFGYRDYQAAQQLLGKKPSHIGLIPVETLESAGFKVVREHPVVPRLRLELPPPFDLLTAAAMDDLLARATV